jgi:hypothetical protein
MADYHSAIARAVSNLPNKTDEARRAIYERARTALQESSRTLEISEAELANAQFALEAAIRRVEQDVAIETAVQRMGQDLIPHRHPPDCKRRKRVSRCPKLYIKGKAIHPRSLEVARVIVSVCFGVEEFHIKFA